MPSIDEMNAAFDAIEDDLHQLVASFVPAFFKQQAIDHIDSQQGREVVLDGVKKALVAAERVRAKAEAAHNQAKTPKPA